MSYKVINLDMDGVLADFNGRMREICGKTFEDFGISADAWKAIHGYEQSIYLDLKPLPGTRKFVDNVIDFAYANGFSVAVLTGVPKHNRIPLAEMHKRFWLRKYFPELLGHFKIGPWSEDKWKHCYGPQDILIDDLDKNIVQWRNAGGLAIHHKSIEDTIQQLEEIRKQFISQ